MRPPAPTYSNISLSVFFPAYYDEHNIPKVVAGTLQVIEELGILDYEIVIVEDGSPDRTGEVADELASRHEHVREIDDRHELHVCIEGARHRKGNRYGPFGKRGPVKRNDDPRSAALVMCLFHSSLSLKRGSTALCTGWRFFSVFSPTISTACSKR